MRNALIAVTALLSISLNAYGGDNGIYLGGALGRSSIDTNADFFGFGFGDEEAAYKVIAGIRPIDSIAIEANYVNFGSIVDQPNFPDSIRSEYEAQAIDAFVVGFIGGPFVELFGKVGLAYWDTDVISQGGIGGIDLRDSDSGADLVFGGGVQLQFASLAARLEYENFDISGADKLDMWSLGLTWTFL